MAHRVMLSNNQLFNKVPFNSAFWMIVFSLPSIILAALLGNNFNGLKRSWFVICDWWVSIRFVCFCVSRFVACDRNYDWWQRKTQLWRWLLHNRVCTFVKSTVKIARCVHHPWLSIRCTYTVEHDCNVTLEWTLDVR